MKKKYSIPAIASATIDSADLLINSIEYGGGGSGRPADARLRRKYYYEDEAFEEEYQDDCRDSYNE